jgi:hypothetical protein
MAATEEDPEEAPEEGEEEEERPSTVEVPSTEATTAPGDR